MSPNSKQSKVATDAHTSCLDATASGAVSGCLAGLLGGMIWGIVQEKKFIFRNMNKEYHLREPPIALFSVMMRGTTTMLVMGTFFGVLSGLRCSVEDTVVSRQSPVLPGTAGTAAGLVRSVMSEIPKAPVMHARKAAGSGMFAAGVFAVAEMLDAKDTEHVLDRASEEFESQSIHNDRPGL